MDYVCLGKLLFPEFDYIHILMRNKFHCWNIVHVVIRSFFLIVSSKFKYPQEDSYLDFESAISHETLLSQLLKPN
jgi:hypothetical protein